MLNLKFTAGFAARALAVCMLVGTAGALPALAQETGKLDKPAKGDPAQPAEQAKIMLELTTTDILVNGQSTTLDGFADAMKAAAGDEGKDATVAFKVAHEVPVSRVYEVQQQLQALRMKKVMYGGKEGGRVPMALPSEEAKAKLAAMPAGSVMAIKVGAGKQVSVDGADTPPAKVAEMVKQRVVENAKLVISLTMAPDATFKEMANVLEQLREAGADRIVMNEPAM